MSAALASPPLHVGGSLRAARLRRPGPGPDRLGRRHQPAAHERADAVAAGPGPREPHPGQLPRGPRDPGNLPDALINSAVVATLTAVIALTLGSAAAYALARLRVPGADRILLAVLATQMFPGIVIAIPLFIVFTQLRLIDTYLALVAHVSVVHPRRRHLDPEGLLRVHPAAARAGRRRRRRQHLPDLPPRRPAHLAAAPLRGRGVRLHRGLERVLLRHHPDARQHQDGADRDRRVRRPVPDALRARCWRRPCWPASPWCVLAIVFRRFILKGFVEGAVKG